MTTAQDVLNLARSQLGTSESPMGSNKVPYNTWYYGRPVAGADYPWCSVFVSWLFCTLNAENLIGRRSMYSGDLLAWGQAHGEEVPVERAQPGDIVIFKWNASHTITDHIGIVEAHGLGTRTVSTIEGNSADMVRRNLRTLGSTCLMWFIRPKYSSTPTPPVKKQEDDGMLYGGSPYKTSDKTFTFPDCYRDKYDYYVFTDGNWSNLLFMISGHDAGSATTEPQTASGFHVHNLQDILKQDRMKVVKGSYKVTVTSDTPVAITLREVPK